MSIGVECECDHTHKDAMRFLSKLHSCAAAMRPCLDYFKKCSSDADIEGVVKFHSNRTVSLNYLAEDGHHKTTYGKLELKWKVQFRQLCIVHLKRRAEGIYR